ncbi:MAG: TetR/AcrR family transcriptional regulator, partial [Sphaerochaetaceae bacterium]|nr:TetR/AcrR family transcriptional regulator [Sphaerochaetaceae bacterium]
SQSMKELLKTKSLEKIRVTEICKAASIERPTFYYHFKDKYDLMAWMFMYSAYDTDITNLKSATEGLEKMRSQYIFYKRVFEDNSQNPLWKYMHEYFVKRHLSVVSQALGTEITDSQLVFSIRVFCYGALGVIREWIFSDNITPASVELNLICNSMPENLKKFFYQN